MLVAKIGDLSHTRDMTRSQADILMRTYLTDKRLISHSLAAEACMRMIAKYFGEDEEIWGLVGLLHDADYQLSRGNPSRHGTLLFDKKEAEEIPTEIAYAIKAHNYEWTGVIPKSRMDWAITCCDQLTGIIMAVAQSVPSKQLSDVSLEYCMQKLRQRTFLPDCPRTQIYQCEETLGIPLIQFVTMCLEAMQSINTQLEA